MKQYRKILLLVAAITFSILASQAQRVQLVTKEPLIEATSASGLRALRTVDGDTFEIQIDGVREKIRMLGIDTPESVDPRKPVECFAHEASDELRTLIMDKDLILTPDETNSDRDKYGRLLRYVSLAADGTSVNAEMIKLGFARAYIKFPFTRRAEYLKLQTEARDAGRGLWSPTTCHGRR